MQSRIKSFRSAAIIVGITAIASTGIGAGSAHAAPAQQGGPVNLLSEANLQLNGKLGHSAGRSVAGAGDVNGDGRGDVIIGVPFTANHGSRSGSAYVVFGEPSSANLSLESLGASGFRIDGANADDIAGASVSGAGDVNGDGLDDLVVGAPWTDHNGGFSGSAYVVFGKTTSSTVDVTSLGANGFRIDGAVADDVLGYQVAEAGDVNGDGLSDVLVGATGANYNGADAGSAYVVFGKASSGTVDVGSLAADGFRIDAVDAGNKAFTAVASAGDVNTDGLADVVIGAHHDDKNGTNSGSAYVVFGKASSSSIDLATLGSSGYRIDGASAHEAAGFAVDGVGDVNGDGRPDLVVGAPNIFPGAPSISSAYVVFGKSSTSTVDLGSLGSNGFRIKGGANMDATGHSVATVGDVNDDGLTDVIVGAPWSTPNGYNSGSAYVVYGKSSTTTVDLAALGSAGFRIDGGAANDVAGLSVGSAGDANADGYADVIVGAPWADNDGDLSGSAYVIHGFKPTSKPPTGSPEPKAPTVDSPRASHDVPSSCARLTSAPPLSSVSNWTKTPSGVRTRIRGPIGGLTLTSVRRVGFKLQLDGTRARKRSVRKVVFLIDGKRVAVDRRAPFTSTIETRKLSKGRHSVKLLLSGRKATKKLSYGIYVTDCRPAKFSAAMSTKKPGAAPNLKLTSLTFRPRLAAASISLPKALKMAIRKNTRGKAIGSLTTIFADGKRKAVALMVPRSKQRSVILSSQGAQVSMANGSTNSLSVSNLPDNVTGLSFRFNGKARGLLKNPARCSKLAYRAKLTDRTGHSVSLTSKARVC